MFCLRHVWGSPNRRVLSLCWCLHHFHTLFPLHTHRYVIVVCPQARTLLIAGPALLAMQPHTLAVKLQQLQALAATHPSWSAAHSSCPSKTLAILLTYSLERQLRLHYLAAHGLQDK